jgi:hypothetical protein
MIARQLADILNEVMAVEVEPDDALTVRYEGTVGSLRIVAIADGLEMISMTQMLAWDLPVNSQLRNRVAAQAQKTMLGTVTLVDQPAPAGDKKRASDKNRGDVVLRYNFPANGLAEDPLRTLIMMVLAAGADVGASLKD